MPRFLRPGRLVRSGGATWLVDESWPVAAAINDDGSTSVLAWSWQYTRISSELDHAAVADGVGIVVRDGEQVAWLRQDGNRLAPIDGDLMLAAADPDTAWFVDRSFVDPGRPPASPPPLSPGRIVALGYDGSRTQLDTFAPVNAIGIRGGEVWVSLAEPPLAHPHGHGWSFEYPRSVVRVSKEALLADGLAGAVPATGQIPTTAHPRPSAWSWLEEEPATVLRYGERAGGLVWWAGTPHGGDAIERRVVVVGHDPETGQPAVRVDLGRGLVRDVQPVGDELGLALARRRYLAVPCDRGVDVLAVSASGAVRTIHSVDSIGISRYAPRLHRPPQQEIRKHIEDVRHRFDHLDAFWRSEDGTTSPLSRGLSDPSVSVEGEWPDARVVVTVRHRRRPGLVLRRTLPLFDETGAPIDHEYADIHLMEDLDTDYLAPAEEAVDGVLDT